jgi:hypothetical protein
MKTKNDPITRIEQLRSSKSIQPYERRRRVTKLVIETLSQEGKFFRTPQGGFYFHTPSAQLFPLEYSSRGMSAFIEDKFGLNEAEKLEYRHLMTAIANHAYRTGVNTKVYRLAHYDSVSNTLYVSRFDGSVFRLDGQNIQVLPNGVDGVFFCDEEGWEPYKLIDTEAGTGTFERLILNSISFSKDGPLSPDEQRWALRVWLLAQFFDTLHPTKPLALVCGEKGGGKTLASRKWLRVLFGSEGEVTALERSKPDGFIAAVSSQPIAVFDNVDEHVGWLPDHLAQMATGVTIRRRELYTTNGQARYFPNCWIALTSRTSRFLNGRDDVLDRTLIFRTTRLANNTPEHRLLEEVHDKRDRIWSELLHCLNRIVAYYRSGLRPTQNIPCRMADFGEFALNLGRMEGDEAAARVVLKKIESARAAMLFDQDPLSDCLHEWLTNAANRGRDVTCADLCPELEAIAENLNIEWPYTTPRSLGQRLTHVIPNLRETFDIDDSKKDSSEVKHYFFLPKTELNRPESGAPTIQESQVNEEKADLGDRLNH